MDCVYYLPFSILPEGGLKHLGLLGLLTITDARLSVWGVRSNTPVVPKEDDMFYVFMVDPYAERLRFLSGLSRSIWETEQVGKTITNLHPHTL